MKATGAFFNNIISVVILSIMQCESVPTSFSKTDPDTKEKMNGHERFGFGEDSGISRYIPRYSGTGNPELMGQFLCEPRTCVCQSNCPECVVNKCPPVPDLICPPPVCPKPSCPKRTCPKPVCPQSICTCPPPKLDELVAFERQAMIELGQTLRNVLVGVQTMHTLIEALSSRSIPQLQANVMKMLRGKYTYGCYRDFARFRRVLKLRNRNRIKRNISPPSASDPSFFSNETIFGSNGTGSSAWGDFDFDFEAASLTALDQGNGGEQDQDLEHDDDYEGDDYYMDMDTDQLMEMETRMLNHFQNLSEMVRNQISEQRTAIETQGATMGEIHRQLLEDLERFAGHEQGQQQSSRIMNYSLIGLSLVLSFAFLCGCCYLVISFKSGGGNAASTSTS